VTIGSCTTLSSMPFSISRLRRWFVGALIFVCVVVAGTYFYARHRVENALKQVPGKIGIEIQQSAQGFTISKSEQGRTLFKVQASKAVQFKGGGHAELHDVTITIYGSDSSRFDQVYGKEFEYDQQTGDIASHGEVSIDLQSNPQGLRNQDQAAPKELKDPIHLKTTNLVFNQKTGDGWTESPIEFSIPQADGSAVGARYTAKDERLTLQSQVRIVVHGATPSTIIAQQAVLEKNPREVVLRYPHAESPQQRAQADAATLFLREDNTLDHGMANGDVVIESAGASESSAASGEVVKGATAPTWSRVSAQKLELRMKEGNSVKDAVLSGAVKFNSEGTQPAEASAGRVLLTFGPENTLTKAHPEQQVKLSQHQKPGSNQGQDVDVSAPAMDFFVADSRRLTRAETVGPPEISLLPTDARQAPTRVTADKFIARFDSLGQLSQVHGEANARVVTTAPPGINPPRPDRISTSDSIDAYFHPGTGIETLVQTGHFTYSSGTQKTLADHARYTPADQILALNGSPRVLDVGMETTARTVRLNRATGDGFAEGDVKTTYSDLKAQPNGALLASSDPVHVTARSMTAHGNPGVAVYTGNARLWQDANVVEAPSIQFQKEQRTVIADSNSSQKVSTVLVGTDKSGKATPVSVVASHLIYRDSERKAHFEGGVTVSSADLTVTSQQMDVFLVPASAGTGGHSTTDGTPVSRKSEAPAKLEKIIAFGKVVMTEPNRHGTGDKLVYTASDDKFVLTGGPPSIFDAEHGKITGVSLTLYRRSDRFVVEGDSSSPAVTQTRVVR
jgi:lipopolysaccharide export system protein LptA